MQLWRKKQRLLGRHPRDYMRPHIMRVSGSVFDISLARELTQRSLLYSTYLQGHTTRASLCCCLHCPDTPGARCEALSPAALTNCQGTELQWCGQRV